MPPAAAGAVFGVRSKVARKAGTASFLQRAWIACGDAAGALVSVLAPADCAVCNGALLEARHVPVCETCLAGIETEVWRCCARCGERLPMDEQAGAGFSHATEFECDACATDTPLFVRALAAGPYTGTLRDLIRLHKFQGMQELKAPLGSQLIPVLRQVAAEAPSTRLHVVAVPLFRSRRRYNQSSQVADAALRELQQDGASQNFQADHAALQRIRSTESQSHLTPAQRRKNVRGAFAVNGNVSGWTVVLVDDVYTTGATAAECVRVLRAAGATAVYVATLARTQPYSVGRWSGEFF